MRSYRKLISRWLWNVNAVMEWADNPRDNDPEWWQQSPEVTTNNQTPVSQQSLSSKSQEYPTGTDKIAHSQSHASLSRFDHYISDFAGQGRQIGYNGLAYAVLVSVYDTSHDDRQIQKLDTIVAQALSRLEGPRPGSWWVLSVISLAIVWLEIGMAFMTSYNVPTIGIGCRSMSYLIYGGLSSIPWMIQFLPWFRQPGTKRKALCHGFCVLSTFCLLFITFAAVC